MRRALAILAFALAVSAPAAQAAGRCGDHPWCDTSLTPHVRADLLEATLTRDEKISLLGGDDLFGVAGGADQHTGTSDGIPRVELPTTYYSDGPVGPRQGKTTALPVPMALAATFDPGMARRHGDVVANEAKSKGNDVVFAPTVNIMRTPLGGRTFEGYGEDPYLVGRMAVGWIEAAQAQGVMGDVKHFAANNQEGDAGEAANQSRPGQILGPPPIEGDRMTVNVNADERTLREIYLPQFEAAVKEANVASVMCSYNRLNGPYACENKYLLEDVLKHDWGFKGYVLADYGATHSTAASLTNGLDFEPWTGQFYSPPAVNAAALAGQAGDTEIDDHVHRILETAFRHGFFDRPAYVNDDAQIDKAAHAATAQKIEESAVTLLRNKGAALPLDAGKLKSIALIGGDANEFKTGGGSGAVTPFSVDTPRDAIAQRAGSGVDTRFDDGSDAARAAALAKSSDVALVFAGDYQTEGSDKHCLTLECPPYRGDQDALIEAVAAANPNTIVVLETGGPVLTPWRDKVRAVVEAWYPGQEGGPAIARVLFGDADPGGRLPVTFPRAEGDIPTAGDPEKYPGVNEQVFYREGVLVGYRSYDAKRITPAFPFGHGLSYTKFSYRHLRVKRTGARRARVTLTVRNTGGRSGVTVPQLYLALPQPSADVVQPPRQLKGMRKFTLRPGQSRRVKFRIRPRDLSYWDVKANGWKVAPGCYGVEVGRSSRSIARRAVLAIGGAHCKPAARKCRRARSFGMHAGVPATTVRRITIYVNGRRQATVSGPRRLAPVHVPAHGRVHVRLVMRTVDGRRVVRRKTFGPCSPKRRPHRRL
ncbi:MAG: beta-glucosidase [Thermoleophilaceae bacterium]|nr:beta-glucosidase [Thermoleophilaceae bacterium]